MKKIYQLLILIFLCSFIQNGESYPFKDGTIYTIDGDIPGTSEYKTKTMTFGSSDTVNYFKYEFKKIPSSDITAFKIDITPFSTTMEGFKVHCTNLATSASETDLKSAFEQIKSDESKSTCVHINQMYGYLNSIMKLDSAKPLIGIAVYLKPTASSQVKINLRITEKVLGIDEFKPTIDEQYSMIPITLNTTKFREIPKSKILFYSSTRTLFMYESTSSDNFPTKLFSGNILNVYTNPNMIKQKYHSASIMTLIANPLNFQIEEKFIFEMNLFESNYLLDYYVSSNPDGRPINSPLLINMTDCENPYYVILNYNAHDNNKILILDEIYGKLSNLGVATTLEQETWNDMIQKDIKDISLNDKKYKLPISATNIDVYKIQCTLPVMLNFYYVEEESEIFTMKEGDIQIFNLDPYQTINVPFFEGMTFPEILIEVNQPENNPFVIIEVTDENVYKTNTLVKHTPMTISKGINIKERGGSTNTRVIIKVAYSNKKFKDLYQNVKYSSELNTYLFEFPNDALNKDFYTYANLTMSGENQDDNIKFCFTTSIGGALKPSSENCYRVSKTNSYSLKVYNPFIMYKNYEYSDDLKYSVTLKPVTEATNFGIKADIYKYDTTIRIKEGTNSKIKIDSNLQNGAILTPPEIETNSIFVQIQVCDEENSIETKVLDVLNQDELLPSETIDKGQKNKYRAFTNKLMDTEFYVSGKENTEVFLRMAGLSTTYTPSFSKDPKINYDESWNTLYIESPFETNEDLEITVLIDDENVIKNKGYTLCSFVDKSFNDLAKLHQSVTIENGKIAFMLLNFAKAGYEPGDKFDALVYYEQLNKGKMVFISKLIQGTVGEVPLDTIHQINETYSEDPNYLYKTVDTFDYYFYFSYLPENTLEVPIGAFGIELDESSVGEFWGVYCTFVDRDADEITMIEEIESAIEEDKSYCTGGRSSLSDLRYNYIFKYEYESDGTPKKMVIKILNDNFDGKFTLYMKTDQGEEIVKTDFNTQKEYGQDETYKKSIIPYIVDVKKLRGEGENYVSKVLFFSKHLELQMYYVPTDSNVPIKLFNGNIGLVYTNPSLAEQKYHSTKLVLFTEDLTGKSHPSLGYGFRFHTKMFHSNSMIEFFVSQNPSGRTLNFPLSLEMNTCDNNNNKLYYLLNYNEEEPTRRLHLDMVFGNYRKARIATEINQEHWDDLLADKSSMSDINDFKAELPSKSQHIDIIEVTCETPLLINAYYTKDDFFYTDIEKGGVVLKLLPGQSSFNFSFKRYDLTTLEYTISLYNPTETPDVTLSFYDGTPHRFTGNSLQTGVILSIPETVTILNNCKSETRVIFKFGLAVESTWKKESIAGIDGELYYNSTSYVYKFPIKDNKHDFRTVDFLIKSIDEKPNIKFCYSTNLGNAIETSRENCFRTGRYIPYTLSFINPLIMGKNYYTETDKYYVTLKPFNEGDSISVTITENKYEVKNRNELGKAKELTITNGRISSILTMPIEPMNIFFQIKSCKTSTNPIDYKLYNAFNLEDLHSGKIYYTDPYGIYYISTTTYMENQIDLIGENINLFTKHAAISDSYSPNINLNYSVSFDQSSNSLNIIKPILGEEFTFTVIIDKDSLQSLTQCDLAFKDKTQLGDYVKTFTSSSSDRIIHFVDFASVGYTKGTQFYALVYAEQMLNSKMEFIYQVITGEVGTASGTVKIDQSIEGEVDYFTADFKVKSSSNYLYYDFPRTPIGNIASIRINSESTRVNKVGCVFVSNKASEDEMISEVNKAVREDKSCCVGDNYEGNNGFDALINAKYESGNNRLVIQVLYGFGEGENDDEENDATIIIKNKGTDLSEQGQYPSKEPYSAIPYVIDLLKIRGTSTKDYVSKILFYSNTREMQMFYITDSNPKPVTLFTGNIMMVYTNEELIKQKYQGATTMILLTDALSETERPSIGEQYRFITYFFKSEMNVQYFLSGNEKGRPLNNPTAIEMTSCTQPYYYIMNYNKVEDKRKLHIDTVFGEKKAIKLAQKLNEASWDQLIENMETITGDEVVLEPQNRFHFDVIEVTCNVPLLINLFYTDPEESKVTNLETGDITVLSLAKGQQQDLTFKMGEKGPFHYSFTVEKNSKYNPKISITFNGKNEMEITENGVYTKYWVSQYNKIEIQNNDVSGNTNTRVIFKFGIGIETIYDKDKNGVYSNLNDEDREYNLYGYIYDQNNKLDYTGVDFKVTTEEDNVKFCYSTNIGTYIYPSLQNCYRVGKNNPYTISTLSPYVMYKNYTTDNYISYYVGFRTLDKTHNITINPIIKKYDTTERNTEGKKNKVKISSDTGDISTILTAPANHEQYVFVETCLCTKKAHVSYQFLNAYNHSNLGSDGQLNNNKVKISVFENPKLDSELKIFNGQNGYEIFVKHSGYTSKSFTSPQKIVIKYDRENKNLTWNPPLYNEKFEYHIYIDKIDIIKKQNYTLCDIAEVTKLGHHEEIVESDNKTLYRVLDFSHPDLGPDYGEFDVIIVAEQLQKQKFTFISATYDSLGNNNDDPDDTNPPSDSKTGLIIIISILSIVIIGGGIAGVLIFLKYRKKAQVIEQNKQTSMALLNSTSQGKLVESQVQVDP